MQQLRTEKASAMVILRREYLDITGNFCAAKLIEYFKHWTNWKLKNHRTPWVYQPLRRIYADLMGEHSLHVIRAAIALLEKMGILEKQKNPGNGQDKTWQYKLHFDVLNQLLERRKFKNEPSTFNAEQHHRSDPKVSDPQQHAAAEGENQEEVDWETVAKETETWEQSQITHYVNESEQVDLTNEINSGEDKLPQGQVEVITTSLKDVTTSNKPTKPEIKEVCNQLKRLRINPDPCLGVIKKYWGNVQGAIARVKEAIHEGWCENPTGLFINSCKSGAKAKNTVTSDVSAWFEWARRERLVLAMSGGVVYTLDGEAVKIKEMMQRYPMKE
ncbi:MAG: ArsR family transcriptional regulator [Calothrix sp. MO_167.B12]|nr:ArsR family transcriptional regulator [Calothrix sp. MO_167.B12]